MWRLRSLVSFGIVSLLGSHLAAGGQAPARRGSEPEADTPTLASRTFEVTALDGIAIAVECAGSGPTLLMVHGGIGDRSRWTPMFPLLANRFTACAMERMILYEPPVDDPSDAAMIEKIESLVAAGERERAALTFWREVVKYSPEELDAMQKRPNWPKLVADFDSHPRQMRALAAYRFDPERVRSLRVSTLLLLGGETESPTLEKAIAALDSSIPDSTLVVLAGQEHNAMDTDREQLARAILTWLLAK